MRSMYGPNRTQLAFLSETFELLYSQLLEMLEVLLQGNISIVSNAKIDKETYFERNVSAATLSDSWFSGYMNDHLGCKKLHLLFLRV